MSEDKTTGSGELDTSSTSAMHWAEQFCKTMKQKKWALADIDEGLMIGWFAYYWAAVSDPLTDRIEELEEKLQNTQDGAIAILTPECDKHTGELTPPLLEWFDKYAGRCVVCDKNEIESLRAKVAELEDANKDKSQLLARYERRNRELEAEIARHPK